MINPIFLDIIKPFPNLSILFVNSMNESILSSLIDKVAQTSGTIDLRESNRELLDSVKVDEIESKLVKIEPRYFDPELNFKTTSREYEYVIIADALKDVENQLGFLKSIYHSMENSADLILISQKDSISFDDIKINLEKIGFLAINELEVSDDYFVITAKKMHMWGNGL